MSYSQYQKREADRLVDAINEAERFTERARALLSLHDKAQSGDAQAQWDLSRSNKRSAAHRASLDLTNALVLVRRSQYTP